MDSAKESNLRQTVPKTVALPTELAVMTSESPSDLGLWYIRLDRKVSVAGLFENQGRVQVKVLDWGVEPQRLTAVVLN